jgi:hypothetical protein
MHGADRVDLKVSVASFGSMSILRIKLNGSKPVHFWLS